jgi:hypothetical protein
MKIVFSNFENKKTQFRKLLRQDFNFSLEEVLSKTKGNGFELATEAYYLNKNYNKNYFIERYKDCCDILITQDSVDLEEEVDVELLEARDWLKSQPEYVQNYFKILLLEGIKSCQPTA